LGRRDTPPGKEELLCHARTHNPGMCEILHPRYAHPHDRVREISVVGGDDQITAPGEHEAAGDACSLNCGNRWLGYLAPPSAHAEIDLGLPRPPCVRARPVDVSRQ